MMWQSIKNVWEGKVSFWRVFLVYGIGGHLLFIGLFFLMSFVASSMGIDWRGPEISGRLTHSLLVLWVIMGTAYILLLPLFLWKVAPSLKVKPAIWFIRCACVLLPLPYVPFAIFMWAGIVFKLNLIQ